MNSGVEEAKLTLQRLVGKFALLFAFIYALMVAAGFIRVFQGDRVPVSTWLLLILPGIAFVPAVRDAVGLHRTTDPARLGLLWKRCGLSAVAGMALLVIVAFTVEGIN